MGDLGDRAAPVLDAPAMGTESWRAVTGLKQITRPYGLRYGAANAFNQSSE